MVHGNITRDGDQVTVLVDCSVAGGSYNQGLAIGSVFVIFVVSFIGFVTPYVLSTGKHKFVQYAIAACAFGGTAVLLTVGFVHILGDALTYLENPCLPQEFLDAYPGWASLFCVVTIMLLMLLDYTMRGVIESLDTSKHSTETCAVQAENGVRGGENCSSNSKDEETGLSCQENDVSPSSSSEHDRRLKRAVVLFVEMSVCTHSIPVGLALGVQQGDAFISLFIAIIFHQLLEGFGVGAATLDAQYNLTMFLFLATCFALTAPIGITIGIILESTLNTSSSGYLITVGVINACAAGMLIYVALEHMNALSTKGKWLRQQSWGVQVLCFAAFFVAGAAMLAVGKYA